MNRDVSSLAWTVRRQDVSATLRAFFAPAGIAAAWLWLGLQIRQVVSNPDALSALPDEWWFIAGMAIVVVAAALSPFWFVLIDWMARRPWRGISGAIGFLAGAVLHLAFTAFAVSIFAVFATGQFGDFLASIQRFAFDKYGGWHAFSIMIAVNALAVLLTVWLLVRTVVVEKTLSGPTPRSILLGEIRGRGFWSRLAFLLGMPSSNWRIAALILPSFWLLFAARPILYSGAASAGLVPFFQLQPEGTTGRSPITLLANSAAHAVSVPTLWFLAGAGAALLVASHILFALAKRLAARRIWRGGGEKPPILFLRSFRDDRLEFRRSPTDVVGGWLDLWSFRRNADEMLIDEFAQYGPVIALGRPGEKAPPFGAQRRYTTDEEWQGVIEDAARRARAIVVAAGETPGLEWEYDLIAREGLLDKTIILIPPARRGDEATKMRLARLRESFPDAQFPENFGSNTPIAFLPASLDAPLITARHPRSEAYLVALRRFFQAQAS